MLLVCLSVNVMAWAYKGLGDKNRLQVILWLQEITGGLQGLTGGHKSLQDGNKW